MTESERMFLEGFAQTVGIPYAWNTSPPSSDSFIVFPGKRGKEPGRTFQEYWDAINFLLLARIAEEPAELRPACGDEALGQERGFGAATPRYLEPSHFPSPETGRAWQPGSGG